MNYKLFIFDLDGTILDTLEDLTNSLNAALSANCLPQRTTDEVRRFVGNGIGKLIRRGVPKGTEEALIAQVLADFKAHYRIHSADHTRPYEGVTGLIGQIRGHGGLVAVVSNKADFAVQDLCRHYFPDLIDAAVGEREGVRRKPEPDSVLEMMTHFGVSAGETVYIGDSEVDIQTAQNAGTDAIIVTWGFRDRDFLSGRGAKRIAETPEEILRYADISADFHQ